MRRYVPIIAAAALVLGACSSDSDPADGAADDGGGDVVAPLPTAGDDDVVTGGAAGACLEGEPDCDDTGAAPLPLPDGPTSDGMVLDGGLSVGDALGGGTDGVLAVTGFLVEDADGVRICDALAESFPPQCAGDSMPVAGVDLAADAAAPDLTTEQGVTWTEGTRIVFGEVVDGTLVVSPLVAG